MSQKNEDQNIGHLLTSFVDTIKNNVPDNFEIQKPKDYTKTQSVLVDMLQEKTSMSILDSGDAYGRAFENNRRIT